MELVKREVELPKEISEVAKFLVEVIKDVKAKKDITTIIGENLTHLMAAIDGFDKLGDEIKQKHAYTAIALMVTDIVGILLEKPLEVDPPVPAP